MFKPIHKHLLIRGKVKSPITNESDGNTMLTELVELVGMVPVTEPQSVYVEDAGNEGLTGSINLATSHCAYHIWDRTGLLMADLYSCKDFSAEDVIMHLDELMVFDSFTAIVINRETFEVIEEYKL